MHRSLPLAVLLGLLLGLVACGGGSGSTPAPDPDPDPDPDAAAAEALRVVLQACGPGALDAVLPTVLLFIEAINGRAEMAGVMIDPGLVESMPGFRASWTRDTDMDMAPDELGDFLTEDGAGMPSAPFTDMQLDPLRMNGVAELAALLAMLDGPVFQMRVITSTLPGIDGSVQTPYASGAPGSLSGDLRVTDMDCITDLTFTALPEGNFAGAFPVGTFTLAITQNSDMLAGTMTANGTQTATAAFTHNGGPSFNFTINLSTGQVTHVP